MRGVESGHIEIVVADRHVGHHAQARRGRQYVRIDAVSRRERAILVGQTG